MREKAVKAPGLGPKITVRPPKQQNSTPSRHSAKCRICNHPDRHAIEFDFLNWRNPADLARSYHLRDLTTIYRHAHATGLFAKRRLNLRFAMERIVERVNEVPVTASSVIRAARAITRINDAGQWVDPPSRVVVTHIHAEDSSFVGVPRGTGSQPVDSSVEVQVRPRRSSPIFDPALLDEPSESAAGEMPRIDGKPAPPEIILELTPEFARCREERRRALEADRQSRAASGSRSGGFTPPSSVPPVGAPLAAPAPAQQASGQGTAELVPSGVEGAVPSPTPQEEQSVASSTSLLPQAAVLKSASSALPHHAGFENNVADNKANVASPSSTLPEAAPDKPATACPEQGRGAKQSPRAAGPPLGSSGSADPPFPFTQESRRQWKPRRRF